MSDKKNYWVHSETLIKMIHEGSVKRMSDRSGFRDKDGCQVLVHDTLPKGQRYLTPPHQPRRDITKAVRAALPPGWYLRLNEIDRDELQRCADVAADAVDPGATCRILLRGEAGCTSGGDYCFHVENASPYRAAVPLEDAA